MTALTKARVEKEPQSSHTAYMRKIIPLSSKSAVLYLAFMLVFGPAEAQDIDFEADLERAALAAPEFAFSASYAFANGKPRSTTVGPIAKGSSVQVSQDARWHIGSISKSFTATLIMRLVDRGILALDTPIENYLTANSASMHVSWKSTTLRSLLSHTSGVPANASRSIWRDTDPDKPHNGRRVVLTSLWDQPLAGKPGTFAYSNIGYVLAGIVAEEVTGKTWEALILSEIAEPLGLTSLGFGAPKEKDSARGHTSILGFKRSIEPENPASDNPSWMAPAGTIHLSMTDLAKWGQSHIKACDDRLPSFLTKVSCKTMQRPVSKSYGLGWAISTSEKSGEIIWHNGSNTMWYAILKLFRNKGTVIAVATNVDASKRVEELIQELSSKLLEETN